MKQWSRFLDSFLISVRIQPGFTPPMPTYFSFPPGKAQHHWLSEDSECKYQLDALFQLFLILSAYCHQTLRVGVYVRLTPAYAEPRSPLPHDTHRVQRTHD